MVKQVYKTIEDHQKSIISAFATLAGDRLAMLDYLMEVGCKLPCIEASYKVDAYLVSGCLSKVWLIDREEEGLLFFQADSNTAITKGLISLLVTIFSGQLPQHIVEAKLYCIEAIGIPELVGFQRYSGLAHMVKTIKLKALAKLA